MESDTFYSDFIVNNCGEMRMKMSQNLIIS